MGRVSFILFLLVASNLTYGQDEWPRTIKNKSGATVSIYQPQHESLKGNILKGRTAFSIKLTPADEPIFGAFWFTAMMETDRDSRKATLESIKIENIKLAGVDDTTRINKLKTFLETEIPKQDLETTIDEILASVEEEQKISSENLKNDPPKIIFTTKPSLLVSIDGEPRLQDDEKLQMKRVINTPFLIIQNPKDNGYYLYGGNLWYISASITSGWKPQKSLPKNIKKIDDQIKEYEKKNNQGSTSEKKDVTPLELVVATTPTELIQSNGEPNLSTVDSTSELLFVSNSDDNIFMDIKSNKYFVLLSGRWYSASDLKGAWAYIASENLPEAFKKIPEGSTKDIVLANVAGTNAAKEAVMDAQIPQTAKVDRKKATCTVKYDGEPKFEKIEGTSLSLAMNTNSKVLKSGDKFYCVEDGVWFKSNAATGPWTVSDERPKEVDDIPASSSAYNVKYVYIYDSTPEYVYVGYTPGYMGTYVYGPTVVYGTGYYYPPFYGAYYYPHPATYGFSMHYNPWTGWSMGFHFSYGFFSASFYGGGYGCWGPGHYHPPYHHPYHGGYYGNRGPTFINNGDININRDRTNNIYGGRDGISQRPSNDLPGGQGGRGQGGARPSNDLPGGQGGRGQGAGGTKPSNDLPNKGQGAKPSQQPANSNRNNNVMTDKDGKVYQRDNNNNWQERGNNGWETPSNKAKTNDLNRDMQNRDRGQQRNNNYNQMNRGGNMGGGSRGGGGGRGGGGRR